MFVSGASPRQRAKIELGITRGLSQRQDLQRLHIEDGPCPQGNTLAEFNNLTHELKLSHPAQGRLERILLCPSYSQPPVIIVWMEEGTWGNTVLLGVSTGGRPIRDSTVLLYTTKHCKVLDALNFTVSPVMT